MSILEDIEAEGISTTATFKKEVTLKSSICDKEIVIGKYNPLLPGISNKMETVKEGFNKAVRAINALLKTESEYIYIDEIGYLEKDETEYLNTINNLMEKRK